MAVTKRLKIHPRLRMEVYRRARWRCQYCGLKFRPRADGKAPMRTLGLWLEIDHIEPHSLGGGDDLANFRAACSTCNRSRGVDINDTWAERMVSA